MFLFLFVLTSNSSTKQTHMLLQGWTPMHHAAVLNHHVVMIELLSQKAIVSRRDNTKCNQVKRLH